MAIPITQRAKANLHNNQGNEHPVIEKDNLGSGIVAEANNDGTIYVNKKASKEKKAEAIEHEKVHMDQMDRGDLDYDDNYVYWQGKKYPRDEMKEGDKKLPWEQEAWEANKEFKQEHKSIHNA